MRRRRLFTILNSGSAPAPDAILDEISWYIRLESRTGLYTDAAKTTPAGNGGLIYTWADQSGNGRDVTQATEGSRPTCVTGVLNDESAIRFDGGDTLNSAVFGVALAQPFTIFTVGKQANQAAGYYYYDSQSAGSRVAMLGATAGNKSAIFAGSSLLASVNADTDPHYFTALYNGASSKFRVDGNENTGNVGANSLPSLRLGATAGGALNLVGDEYAVYIYAGAMSDANILLVEAALGYRYALPI